MTVPLTSGEVRAFAERLAPDAEIETDKDGYYRVAGFTSAAGGDPTARFTAAADLLALAEHLEGEEKAEAALEPSEAEVDAAYDAWESGAWTSATVRDALSGCLRAAARVRAEAVSDDR